MPTVYVDRLAESDIAAIATYIGVDNLSPEAARQFVDDLNLKFAQYARQPEMGEPRPELEPGTDLPSFTFKRNDVVIYRPLPNGIDVVRVS